MHQLVQRVFSVDPITDMYVLLITSLSDITASHGGFYEGRWREHIDRVPVKTTTIAIGRRPAQPFS